MPVHQDFKITCPRRRFGPNRKLLMIERATRVEDIT
jgi:hypothetical protein